ncbi:TPA: hypothetical protein DEB00_03300 [Candidatus Uhrbacteria bacterium]|nr:hypothetical protein [Candidatus Uhrbacteria bacterium]
MAIIMHVDFNAYFASVEQQANPFLRGRAIGIGGKPGTRSVITTASYNAKALGVKTAMSSWEAAKICPELEMIHGDSNKYNEVTRRLMQILSRYSPTILQTSIDEAFVDLTYQTKDWLGAIGIALNVKQDLAREIGPYVTASIGIADNAPMAKIAGESNKPDGLTVVRPEHYQEFLSHVLLTDIPGIGTNILRHLEELGISTIKQLRLTPLSLLLDEFKQYGHFLYNISRGIGSQTLERSDLPPKSISHSHTPPRDVSDPLLIRGVFLQLCERVAYRLRVQNVSACSLDVLYKSGDRHFSSTHRQFDTPTQDGMMLFNTAWPHLVSYLETSRLRLIGVRVSELVPAHYQLSTNKKEQKSAILLPVLDTLSAKFGQHVWMRAATIHSKLVEKTSGWRSDHSN